MLEFDKQKYLRILKSEGLNAALTELHRDTERWEHDSFEGDQGWQPVMWKEVEKVRAFSRELWATLLTEADPGTKPGK